MSRIPPHHDPACWGCGDNPTGIHLPWPTEEGLTRYEAVFRFLAKLHLIPKKTDALMQRMNANSASYIQAEEEELLTLNWHGVGQKPA